MVQPKRTRLQRLGDLLRRKYRLILLNDNSLDERYALRLSPLNLIIGILALTIIMTSIVISLIAFTGLREYIPGYGTTFERRQMLQLTYKADSLEKKLQSRDLYLDGLLKAFGDEEEENPERPTRDSSGKYKNLNTLPSKADVQFRQEFEQQRQEPSVPKAPGGTEGLQELLFFPPVNGLITQSFNAAHGHFGTDISTREDELIKCVLDGTIVYQGFTAEDGNIIQVQHGSNVLSIYKHCSSLLKVTGDKIRAGEAIAVVGNSGENSRGAHLHFELWFNGQPIDPQGFVAF